MMPVRQKRKKTAKGSRQTFYQTHCPQPHGGGQDHELSRLPAQSGRDHAAQGNHGLKSPRRLGAAKDGLPCVGEERYRTSLANLTRPIPTPCPGRGCDGRGREG
jgi:hypothetical protein